MHYIFPFESIKKGEDIILYGAGVVGQEFYAQIFATKYCNVVAWIDKDWEFYQSKGLSVTGLTGEIKDLAYNHIVIAIADKKIATEVIETLGKVIARKMFIWQQYTNGEPENGIVKQEKKQEVLEAEECNPERFVSADTLDLAVRYLLCRDIINKIENRDHLNLYMRYMLVINNLRSMGIGDKRVKTGSDEFMELFEKLVLSMQSNGFYKANPILVDSQNKVINGRHRLTSALAMEKKIWASQYGGARANIRDWKWFYDNGFTTEDMQSMLYGFSSIYKKCNIILLFGSIKNSWEFIFNKFEKEFKVVGYFDLDFRNDYIGFENLIHDIYNDVLWDDPYKDRKLRLLKFATLIIRVIMISDEGHKDIDIYKKTSLIKKSMRNHFVLELGDRKANITLHAGDSEQEFLRLRNLLLSKNNLWHNSVRTLRRYGRRLVNKLNLLKTYLGEIGVPIEAICIVGSAGLEVYGLREAGDIDFIVQEKFYHRILGMSDNLPEGIELVKRNSMSISEEVVIDNDIIINDECLHYTFYECKFLNLELLKEIYTYKSKQRKDEKAYEDSLLLDIFFEYAKWFDDRKALQRQLERETDRNRWTT